MYKNLSFPGLGISGRQSEVIESALTYGFDGIELDFVQFVKQAELRGLEYARRFIDSAKLKIGCFELPVCWQAEEATYRKDLSQLPSIASMASAIGATVCSTTVMPACDKRPYHENFTFHGQRLSEIADLLKPHGLHLGLDFLAAKEHQKDREYQFICQSEALIVLIKTSGVSNLGLSLDLWNWHVGGGNALQLKELSAETIVSVSLSDLPTEANLKTITEDQRLLPGETGEIDAASYLSVLSDIGYQGPVTLQANFSKMTREAILEKSQQVLQNLWQAKDSDSSDELLAVGSDSGDIDQ